ncbi:hypothetical protein DAEQUDRAFT_764447 [Daedalea quercina L-15889]|uniref:Secreted protein n=1 Tax=Daedalea quercina L-15889 TaxID=1314783 RepID=A0A165RBQ7_9APHY|nr:hypothetical protein DAEQUDRAFT_764447 [Daedalea quercina L-15889]
MSSGGSLLTASIAWIAIATAAEVEDLAVQAGPSAFALRRVGPARLIDISLSCCLASRSLFQLLELLRAIAPFVRAHFVVSVRARPRNGPRARPAACPASLWEGPQRHRTPAVASRVSVPGRAQSRGPDTAYDDVPRREASSSAPAHFRRTRANTRPLRLSAISARYFPPTNAHNHTVCIRPPAEQPHPASVLATAGRAHRERL